MRNVLLFILVILSSCHKKNDDVANTPNTSLPDNYFSATVNGNTVKGTTSSSNRGFSANFSDTTAQNRMVFTIEDWYTGPGTFLSAPIGTYELSTGTYKNGSFYASYATLYFNNKVYHTDANNTGSLAISNVTGKIITGTFNFTGVDSSGNKISVNNGVLNNVSL